MISVVLSIADYSSFAPLIDGFFCSLRDAGFSGDITLELSFLEVVEK